MKTKNAEVELKPCPFCGGKAAIREREGKRYVCCTNILCSVRVFTPDYYITSEAIAAWNNRVCQCGKEEK